MDCYRLIIKFKRVRIEFFLNKYYLDDVCWRMITLKADGALIAEFLPCRRLANTPAEAHHAAPHRSLFKSSLSCAISEEWDHQQTHA